MKTGLIHIYTGNGKGKSTAAVGLCNRAIGHGLKTCYVSFHKNPEKYGYNEINSLQKLGVNVYHFAKGHPHLDSSIDSNVIRIETIEGLKKVKDIIANEKVDLLVLDEILISIRDNFIKESELINFITEKPENLELVLTGRGATQKLLELADYVSEINCTKHPYSNGIKSRKGIEF
jgi:cob(I)alamin adenosyltransferase